MTTHEFKHCHIELRQGGRQNNKRHMVCMGGRVVFVNAQWGNKAHALKLAARIDRLVEMWRKS
jgi:hypothetical protein